MKRKIGSGIYLVIDPSMEEFALLHKLKLCLQEGLAAVQIWDHFVPLQNVKVLVEKICALCHEKEIAVLINNRWELMLDSPLDGVHFDEIPENYEEIKRKIAKPFLSGLTCNNDMLLVHWATDHHLDYISFCSVFPSSTSNSCELVNFKVIEEASLVSRLPIFLAGGIKPENVGELDNLNYTGIAVISGVMNADRPDESVKKYREKLKINRV